MAEKYGCNKQTITELTKMMLSMSTLRMNDQQQSYTPLVNRTID